MRLGIDAIDSKKKHAKHQANVLAKEDVLYRTRLLLDVWEWQNDLDEGKHHAYVLHLRAKVRGLTNQRLAMRPVEKDEF